MQYYQLRYIIKFLLLNGLFVLSSHSMDRADPLPRLPILSLPLNELSEHLLKLSDQPPVSAVCSTVPVSQLPEITTFSLSNCNQTFEPFSDNTGDVSNSRSDNTSGMLPSPLNQHFYSSTDSCEKQNKKKLKKNDDKNCERSEKKIRINLTSQEKEKRQREKKRQSQQKHRNLWGDAIGNITEATNAVGEGHMGLNNALKKIYQFKDKYNTLLEKRKKQMQQYNESLKKYYQWQGFMCGFQFATTDDAFNNIKFFDNADEDEHCVSLMCSECSEFLISEFLINKNIKKRIINQSDDQNSGRAKKKKRTNLTLQQKKKIRLEENRLSAQRSRKKLKDAAEVIVEETGTTGIGYRGLNNAANEIFKWKSVYTMLGKQFEEQEKQIANLETKYSQIREFIDSIPCTTSDKQLVKSILETCII